MPIPKDIYTSKTKEGECKNPGCVDQRRDGSAYCKKCSDQYKEIKNGK